MGSGEFQGAPTGAAKAGVRALRQDCAGGSAELSDSRAGWRGRGCWPTCWCRSSCDHQPLYRQEEIYARQGVELDRATLADWVGGASQLFAPLVEALRRHLMVAGKLHADDTRVPVLAPGNGRRKRGGCGPTRATIGQRERRHRQRCGSPTRRTARANIRRRT